MTDRAPWWRHPEFPRASAYDPEWLLELDMGPHPLWLLEDLARDVDLRPGQRILDLGSGGGATSVFLAREYGAEVWATDLWLPAERVTALMARPELADVADRIHVVNADARALPFDDAQFDVIVSIDAWEYFGTGDRFLPGLLRHLRPGGQVAMATPCLDREFARYEDCPAHVRELVGWEATAWHTPAWWRTHWERCGLVDVKSARAQESGWSDWLRWSRAVLERDPGAAGSVRMLERDGGAHLSFALVAATKRAG